MNDSSMYLSIGIVVISVCCGLVITAAAIAIPFLWMRKKRQQAEHLAAVGTQGEAKILSLTDTGMLVNNNPRVTVELEITIPMRPPYRVTKTMVVPLIRMSQVQVGETVGVMVDMSDPTNPDKVGLLLK